MNSESTTALKDKAFNAAMDLLMGYMNKRFEITGLLAPNTSFTLKIEGPFGKQELDFLIRRLRGDAKMLGDSKINETQTVAECVAILKRMAADVTPMPQPEKE